MTQSRNTVHHTKAFQERTHHGLAGPNGGVEAVAAGRSAYREEFQRDYGPDLDEALDVTESGREF